MSIIEQLESNVRSYCRGWPTTFDRASGSVMWDTDGKRYLDFFAGAGALNYGHNHPAIKAALLDYLAEDRVIHGLDMTTVAKIEFLEALRDVVLEPRGLAHKVMFPGPTGTNSVEAALKLARKVTGRDRIVGFTNAFHGMTIGSLAVTGNSMKRDGAGVPLSSAVSLPYCGYMEDELDSLDYFEALLEDEGSGLDKPAAVIVETVQGEGGINLASPRWLRRLAEICSSNEILLIVDDIQMGCGRTGPFFSFEIAGIEPDIITLSKSLSGSGLPLAITLLRPELDVWEPGEHNGTFRGDNPAFVTATAALRAFWNGQGTAEEVARKGELVERSLLGAVAGVEGVGLDLRGRGLAWGIAFEDPDVADELCTVAFERGLLLETSGAQSEVCKLMPPITISDAELEEGLGIITDSLQVVTGGATTGAATR